MGSLGWLWVTLLAVALPEPPPDVRLRNQAANRAFADGDHQRALEGYQAVYAQFPDPRVRFNLALTLEALGRLDEALVHYQAFVSESPDHALAPQVEDRVGQLRQRMQTQGRIRVFPTAPTDRVLLDGVPLPPPHIRWVPPGNHRVTLHAQRGAGVQRQVTVEAGAAVDVRWPNTSAPQPPLVAPSAERRLRWPWVALGGAVAPALVGAASVVAVMGGAAVAAGAWSTLQWVVGTDRYRVPLAVAFYGGVGAGGFGAALLGGCTLAGAALVLTGLWGLWLRG